MYGMQIPISTGSSRSLPWIRTLSREASDLPGREVAGPAHPAQRVAVGLLRRPEAEPELARGARRVGPGPARGELHAVAREREVELAHALHEVAEGPRGAHHGAGHADAPDARAGEGVEELVDGGPGEHR